MNTCMHALAHDICPSAHFLTQELTIDLIIPIKTTAYMSRHCSCWLWDVSSVFHFTVEVIVCWAGCIIIKAPLFISCLNSCPTIELDLSFTFCMKPSYGKS